MSKQNGTIYLRPELPTDEENFPEALDGMKQFCKDRGIKVLNTFLDKIPPEIPSEFDNMLKKLEDSKSSAVILLSLHHLTKENNLDMLQKMGSLIQRKQTVISILDDIEIDENIYEMLTTSHKLLDSISTKIKREKINLGLFRKRQASPDGRIHAEGKRGNFRKKDKDEAVMRLRNQGYTLQQIADQEGISVGRVRNIIKALKEDTLENMPTVSFKDYKGLKPNEMKQT